jgi:hypothetical protein
VKIQIQRLLEENGFHADIIDKFINELPLVVSVEICNKPEELFCFVLPNNLRMHDSVLALGLSSCDPEKIYLAFRIPCDEFKMGGILLLSKTSNQCKSYLIDSTKVGDCILSLVNEFCTKYDFIKN